MLTLRPASERGHFDFGWLNTFHSFSFGGYQDPAHSQFRSLRVLNEDRVMPAQGFGTHGHRDMEILTWVLSGALEHQDSLGTQGVIRPGEAQVMSAGTGIRHSEFNASEAEPVHFLQIWFLPEAADLAPRYDQVAFEDARFRNRWGLLASRDGAEGSVRIFQDVKAFVSRLDAGATLERTLDPTRPAYLHVALGEVQVNGQSLKAGDAAKLEGESQLNLTATTPSEVLLFDLG